MYQDEFSDSPAWWDELRKFDSDFRRLVCDLLNQVNDRLPIGSSTAHRLRELEYSFSEEILPVVLSHLINGMDALDTSRTAEQNYSCGGFGVRLLAAHCRGLTLGSGTHLKQQGDAKSHQRSSRRVGHVTKLVASPRSLTPNVTTRLCNITFSSEDEMAVLFHHIYHILYQRLFPRKRTLNYLMLEEAPRKSHLEIHLGYDPIPASDYALAITEGVLERLAPEEMVEYCENRVAEYMSCLQHIPKNEVQRRSMEAEILHQFDNDREIKKLAMTLTKIRGEHTELAMQAKSYFDALLSNEPWIGRDVAIEVIQALAFYRRLGGRHFYSFPTGLTNITGPNEEVVPPSSLVVMTNSALHPVLQFYVNGVTQAIFDEKESLTLGLLHEEASVMAMISASTHQMDKKLRALEGDMRSKGVDPSLCDRVDQFADYLYHSIRLVEYVHQGKDPSISEIDLSRLLSHVSTSVLRVSENKKTRRRSLPELEISLQVVNIKANYGFMWLMFYNLMDNAVRERSSKIYITSISNHTEVKIYVNDNGRGLTPVQKRNFFERGRDNTGLGASIIQWAAEIHGGRVTLVDNHSTQGTSFLISLPINLAKEEGRS